MEVWLPIPSWPAYEASSLGRIRSKDRIISYAEGHFKNHKRFYKSVVLKPWLQHGYFYVELCNGKNDRRECAVHILVCTTHHGECPEGLECRHLNDIKHDNRSENLRWGTHKENSDDMVRNGKNSTNKGKKLINSQLSARKRWDNDEERKKQSERIKASWLVRKGVTK